MLRILVSILHNMTVTKLTAEEGILLGHIKARQCVNPLSVRYMTLWCHRIDIVYAYGDMFVLVGGVCVYIYGRGGCLTGPPLGQNQNENNP